MTRTQSRLIAFCTILAVASIIGAAYAAFLDHFLRSDLTADSLRRGAVRGLVLGAIVVVFEYGIVSSRWGRALGHAPFLVSLGLRTVATTLVLIGAITVSRLLFSQRGHPLQQWLESGLLRDFLFVALVAFFVHSGLQTKRLIGGRTLLYFLLGRYNRPVVEERIFLLIDIVGSTTIAQRLGEQRALSLFAQFFFDISEPVRQFGGETDLYVGDEVVLSWPLRDGHRNRRAIGCYFAIRDLLDQRQDDYVSKFGHQIEIRAGIHGGPVAVGECGDTKRQVVFIGDTINVAKRLQELCKEYDQSILISGKLLEIVQLQRCVVAERLGSTVLRGRDSETEIYGLTKQGQIAASGNCRPQA